MIEKVLIPSVLFFALSPGFFTSMKTSVPDVTLNALILIALYWAIARVLGLTLTKADLIVPAVLFVLLSPGILLTLPPGAGILGRSSSPVGRWWSCGPPFPGTIRGTWTCSA